jgi:hypothetical protein
VSIVFLSIIFILYLSYAYLNTNHPAVLFIHKHTDDIPEGKIFNTLDASVIDLNILISSQLLLYCSIFLLFLKEQGFIFQYVQSLCLNIKPLTVLLLQTQHDEIPASDIFNFSLAILID